MRGSWVRYGDCHHCHRVVAHGAFLARGRLMPARFASCQPTRRAAASRTHPSAVPSGRRSCIEVAPPFPPLHSAADTGCERIQS